MEIEAKYTITGPLDPATIAALDLNPYTLRDGEQLAHHDILLDTPERAITGTRHSLRLRDENGTMILTFKGPAIVEGSVHRRAEIEARLPANRPATSGSNSSATYDYRAWPKKIARRVEELVGPSEELRPLIEVEVTRRTWVVEREGETIGELALDEGTILAAGAAEGAAGSQGRTAAEQVHELELELKQSGTLDDLAALDERLRAVLPLESEPRSKLERGLALLDKAGETSHKPTEGQMRANPTAEMTGQTPLQLAARAAVNGYLDKLRRHEPKVREGHDSDAVHDMRVAIRRIRSTLELLADAPGFDATHLRALRRHLRTFAHRLGDVRDLDVFLHRIEAYEREYPGSKEGLGLLRRMLKHRRQRARHKLLHALDSAKLRHDLDQVETFATETVDSFGEPRPVLVRHFAGSALWRRYEDILRFESEVLDAPAPELHKLRITCKRARYAVELFDPALGSGATEIKNALIAVQDHLGALQDTVVALATVAEVRRECSEHHHAHHHAHHDTHAECATAEDSALAQYADRLAAHRDHLRETFPPLWERVSGQPLRDQLGALIAGL